VPEILSFDGFAIDLAGRSLRDCDGNEVPLTRAEFALLLVLARHPGRVLSRDQLLDAALGRRAEPYDRSIDVLVGRLRRKIEPDPKVPRFIVTVLGEGYKFAGQLREASAPVQTNLAAPSREEPRAHPLSTERRQLTVISCGLVGSTALASRLDPEDLRAVFAEYHRCCTEVIAPFGGMVAPFVGDHVLAYFGYPEAHENDAERAVRAGLALVDAVAKLVTRSASSLHVRVGIASGLVVAGGMASTARSVGPSRSARHWTSRLGSSR
jgi:DNA-binding winged helix-turn-helix (wHTH) protein